jgi:hypothetical protein
MREQEIRELLETDPFEPFILYVSDGASYEVRHRADVLATRSVIFVGVEPDDSGLPQRSVRIDPLHITRLSPANGKNHKGPRP